VPYYLIVLRAGLREADEQEHAAAHEAFVDSLVQQNVVLLGGPFGQPFRDAKAAYLVRCDGVDQARMLAASDPFVLRDVARPHCLEWRLVGVNPEAIDPSVVVRPGDVEGGAARGAC
jgi:hypothetical protein